MPVHTTGVVGPRAGADALDKLLISLERDGEVVVSVCQSLGEWVVVTKPKGTIVEYRPFGQVSA